VRCRRRGGEKFGNVASIVIGVVAMHIIVRSESFRVMVVGAGFHMFAIISMRFTG
jgi:hypothetical protein